MDLGLKGRHFVLTAASRGLGYATAAELVAEGAEVVIAARDSDALSAAVAGLGPLAIGVTADLNDADAPELILASARPHLDGLLVNVGGPLPGRALDYSDDQWMAAIRGVLLPSLRILRHAVPRMRRGGSIVLVLSSTAKEPIASLGASNVLRPGLGMLVKDLANELGPRGIRVNGVLPGKIATDRLRSLLDAEPQAQASALADIPLGRLGEPTEFGKVAAFLLSPASSYINGVLLPVDGGLLRSPW